MRRPHNTQRRYDARDFIRDTAKTAIDAGCFVLLLFSVAAIYAMVHS